MKVFGAAENMQIEWFTNAGKPSASAVGNLYRVIWVTDLKQLQISDGTNWQQGVLSFYTAGTLPAASAANQYQLAFITDTLQLRVSNGVSWVTTGMRLDVYTSGTIPAAASNTYQMIWVSDLQQFQVSNGTSWVGVGTASGLKNYFSTSNANPNFETNAISPWLACTLASITSTTAPTGAPTLTATQMALSTTATTPLAGTYSGQLVKSAANAIGQGFISGVMTIDREDLGKVLFCSFAYEVIANAANVDASGTSTQSLEVWVYNVTAGTWIQPAGYRGLNQTAGPGKMMISFQTDSTAANNQYRIAIVTAQTAALAYTVNFDDFQMGPATVTNGAGVSDWVSYTPTGSWVSNTTYTGKWRRVGDSAEYLIRATLTGAPTSTSLTLNLASGHVIDTNKELTAANDNNALSSSGTTFSGASNYYPIYAGYGGTTTSVKVLTVAAPVANVTQAAPATYQSGNYVEVTFKVPIVGWSSNVQFSNDTDTRVCIAVVSGAAANVTAANPIIFPTASNDTHGAYSTVTGRFTCPISGYYRVTSAINATTIASGWNFNVYKNAVLGPLMGFTAAANVFNGAAEIFANAGDILDIRCGTGITSPQSNCQASFTRLTGPSVVAASESVNCKYTLAAASQAISTTLPIVWDTKVYDSHNAMNTSTGRYTCPISGKYRVSSTGSISAAAGNAWLYKNAVQDTLIGGWDAINQECVTGTISCLAGDIIDIRGGSAMTFTGGGSQNICIERVGN